MLATSSLGAVWSSCSPDFGVNGVIDRFGQIQPKVLFTAGSYQYGGKRFDCLDKIAQVTAQIASIEQVIVVPYIERPADISQVRAAVHLADFVAAHADAPLASTAPPSDPPLSIMASSATTAEHQSTVPGA